MVNGEAALLLAGLGDVTAAVEVVAQGLGQPVDAVALLRIGELVEDLLLWLRERASRAARHRLNAPAPPSLRKVQP
jgi:hypothetical protein